MIREIEDKDYDRKLEMSDWRFSAAALGMVRYFKKFDIKYRIDRDILYYNSESIEGKNAAKKYFEFAEGYYCEGMHHIKLRQLLEKENLNAEEIKEVNNKLCANKVMKKIFEGIKYSEDKKETIIGRIENNRIELIKETYRYMKSGYKKFANPKSLRKETRKISRLIGYSVDKDRKTKTISYNFNFKNYNGKDAIEFDFISFAFTKGTESIFINNNYTIDTLLGANEAIDDEIQNNYKQDKRKDIRELLFFTLQKGTQFIDYDVEVIIKEQNEEYYKTLFVRKEAMRTFKKINEKDSNIFNLPCRLRNGDYIPVMRIVCEHIINYTFLDSFIDKLLKDGENQEKIQLELNKFRNRHKGLIDSLIMVNQTMYKGGNTEKMDDKKMKAAYATAKNIVGNIYNEFYRECKSRESGEEAKKKANERANIKLHSYRQKLISCVVFKNYDRFIEIVLQLSAYSQVSVGFLSDLAENFEKNKNLAYVFVNNLENFRAVKEEGEK